MVCEAFWKVLWSGSFGVDIPPSPPAHFHKLPLPPPLSLSSRPVSLAIQKVAPTSENMGRCFVRPYGRFCGREALASISRPLLAGPLPQTPTSTPYRSLAPPPCSRYRQSPQNLGGWGGHSASSPKSSVDWRSWDDIPKSPAREVSGG